MTTSVEQEFYDAASDRETANRKRGESRRKTELSFLREKVTVSSATISGNVSSGKSRLIVEESSPKARCVLPVESDGKCSEKSNGSTTIWNSQTNDHCHPQAYLRECRIGDWVLVVKMQPPKICGKLFVRLEKHQLIDALLVGRKSLQT
jgi:hypothetical protein